MTSLSGSPGPNTQTQYPFFVIDGIDGAGKSTQSALLAEALRAEGREVVQVRDPGGTPISDRIRSLLLSPEHAIAPSAELCLYAAARAQLVRDLIRPSLEAGKVVISDRFTWSTEAYQGGGRGLNRDHIAALEEIACGGISPAHVFLLDLDTDARAARLSEKGAPLDRMEREDEAFFRRVRQGFLDRARERPGESTVLAADLPAAELQAAILDKVRRLLTSAP